ncbi:MAG: PocR ligand-binding domain-containing protein [Anaerolineae bacterium]|nr:PocR ligand-binding domain-containing protein [Anaerolineae bacterium]
MDDLLTTKQLQELLQVDRITIYRMLGDGRLSGFKVGGQWRFSRQEIEAWLQRRQKKGDRAAAAVMPVGPGNSLQALPLSCVDAIQGVCAEALDIATVTVNLDGSPLTGISNSCDFCNQILSTDKGRERCAAAWKRGSGGQAYVCHAGLLCVSARIEVGGRPVAMTAGCQFVVQTGNGDGMEWQSNLPRLAAELGLPEGNLRSAANTVHLFSAEKLARISHLLRRVAGTFSELGQERLNLVSRLQHIAEVSKI